MWKFVVRGIRESLERRTSCRTNVYTQSSQDGSTKGEVKSSLVSQPKFLVPTLCIYNKRGFGSTKNSGTRDEQYHSKWNAKHNWSEAVGWSSVVAVGWVVCQSLCLRMKLWERDLNDFWQKPISKIHTDSQFSYLLNHVWNLQPRKVLAISKCNDNKSDTEDESVLSSTSTEKSSIQQNFGPITIEEALAEAKEDFKCQQKLAWAEYELQYGIQAIEEKRFEDAMKHFTIGASLSSSRSMFNLGLCYEKGLGTFVDSVQAAKYYKKAADQGHPDAMYNLGVYYAQGRGGLQIDQNVARSLFTKAARLGHSGAQHALDLEKKFYMKKVSYSKQCNTKTRLQKSDCCPLEQISNNSNNNILKQIVKCEEAFISDTRNASFSGTYNTKNPTDIFLEFLGVHKTNTLPINISLNEEAI